MGDSSRRNRSSIPVPKPILHFQRPRGGGGPQLQMSRQASTANASKPGPNIPNIPNITPSPLQSLGITSEQVAAIAQIIMVVQNQNTNIQNTPKPASRSSTMNVSGTIKEQSRREKTPRRRVLVVRAQSPFQNKRDLIVLIGCCQISHEFPAENRT